MSVNSKDLKKIEEMATAVLSGMKVSLKPEVSVADEAVKVELVGTDTAILIGFHGETLADFSYLLGIMVKRNLDKDIILRVDAAGYMAAKDARVREMAQKAIEKVQSSGFPENLTGLNSYERRLVHAEASHAGLTSVSEGYGRDRKIVIKPSNSSE